MNAQAQEPRSRPSHARSVPRWLTAIVIFGAVLAAAGGIIALADPTLLVGSGEHMNAAANIYARYLFSRNVALAVALLVALSLRARRVLAGLMLLTALIQVLDAVVDATSGRWATVPGLIVFIAVFLAGVVYLSGASLWRVGYWRDDPA